jgi:molybdopterin-containing oxidoreductase family iron-sulfur binding subunit
MNDGKTSHSCKDPREPLVQIGGLAPPYWKSLVELRAGGMQFAEFPGGLPAHSEPPEGTRRAFLSGVGAAAAASLAACRAPTQYAVPLMSASEGAVPGVPNWYATTCDACPSACALLVKQRDGRPIKIEGNNLSQLFGGGTCATGQAALLSLYDDSRVRGPVWKGRPASWQEIDGHVLDMLAMSHEGKRPVVLLSSTLTSPSTLAVINQWKTRYPNFRHVVYDPQSLSALRAANFECFGRAVVPHYRFDLARVIVGFEADFLGTWLSPVEYSSQYAAARDPKGKFGHHVQFESGLSVTGSNADVRIPLAPSEIGSVAVGLLRRIVRLSGLTGVPDGPEPVADPGRLDLLANALWQYRSESLIVCGIQDKPLQTVVSTLNSLLGNIGQTLDLTAVSHQREGDDAAMAALVEEMNGGEIGALMLYGVNPAYDYFEAGRFVDGLKRVGLSISFSDRPDETSPHVDAICPDHHFLEAWGDAEPVTSYLSLSQPLIAPLLNTRATQESLLRWSGDQTDFYTYLRAYWKSAVFPRQSKYDDFDSFWDQSLQDGVVTLPADASHPALPLRADWMAAVRDVLDAYSKALAERGENRHELLLHENVAIRDGRHANNPWLQELPDPINKVTWGNVASVSPAMARKLDLQEGDLVGLQAGAHSVTVPVFVQPGQDRRTIGVALGYGRTVAGPVGNNVGTNLYPLAGMAGEYRRFALTDITIKRIGEREALAGTQSHFRMEGRPISLETSLGSLRTAPPPVPAEQAPLSSLWPQRPHGKHSWGMVVDMNACTGCSACVIACQAENNIPVVGKDQVRRVRIMHWIRIDHYYQGSEDNPSSIHQPMMCQHCGNAPCETVCPVLATTTSSEGLNQQVYNRCIGTRYCANNCPYKVRRFNFYNYSGSTDFNFNMQSPLGRLALNPDVVVRSRGVMEKCSLCVQRIQYAKNVALQGRRALVDGDIQTACQQVCPTRAITFGDLDDSNSRVSRLRSDPRYYQVLDELGTRPAVGYLKKVRTENEA